MQVREETAKLSHVRQLLCDHLRAGKAWKAPRTEEVARGRKARVKVKTNVTDPDTTAKVKVNSQTAIL